MLIVRIYTGDDGESHFEDIDLPYEQMETCLLYTSDAADE